MIIVVISIFDDDDDDDYDDDDDDDGDDGDGWCFLVSILMTTNEHWWRLMNTQAPTSAPGQVGLGKQNATGDGNGPCQDPSTGDGPSLLSEFYTCIYIYTNAHTQANIQSYLFIFIYIYIV